MTLTGGRCPIHVLYGVPCPLCKSAVAVKPCHCGSDVCIGSYTLLDGYACVREVGLAAVSSSSVADSPTCNTVNGCAQCNPDFAPSLLAVPEGRLRELVKTWRERASKPHESNWEDGRNIAIKLCADDLDALLASVSQPHD